VIGSGSTAATLIPVIAPECGHVTMLQRSPTYFRTGRNAIAIADELRELDIDEAWIHEIVRKKILHDQAVFTGRSFTEPEVVKQELLAGVRAYDYGMEAHFTPKYRPWRQGIAFILDGDFLEAIRAGKASVGHDQRPGSANTHWSSSSRMDDQHRSKSGVVQHTFQQHQTKEMYPGERDFSRRTLEPGPSSKLTRCWREPDSNLRSRRRPAPAR
jgi:cation diffusion facilitator CzcD-associated flavoprotein CzcO